MAINLESNNNRNITSQTKKRLQPKSIRFSHNELEILNQVKDRIEKITYSSPCSDTKAFKILLHLANSSTDSCIKKAISKVL